MTLNEFLWNNAAPAPASETEAETVTVANQIVGYLLLAVMISLWLGLLVWCVKKAVI